MKTWAIKGRYSFICNQLTILILKCRDNTDRRLQNGCLFFPIIRKARSAVSMVSSPFSIAVCTLRRSRPFVRHWRRRSRWQKKYNFWSPCKSISIIIFQAIVQTRHHKERLPPKRKNFNPAKLFVSIFTDMAIYFLNVCGNWANFRLISPMWCANSTKIRSIDIYNNFTTNGDQFGLRKKIMHCMNDI